MDDCYLSVKEDVLQGFCHKRPCEDATYKYIDPLFKDVVNWNLIQIHWYDMMRVVLSIKAGKVMPSTLLRKLSSYSKKNRLYQAFLELGKVVRTMFLLEYISNAKMRSEINAITITLKFIPLMPKPD